MSLPNYKFYAEFQEPSKGTKPGKWIIDKRPMEITDPEFFIEYRLNLPDHWQYKNVTFLIRRDATHWDEFTKNRGSDATYEFEGGSIHIHKFENEMLKLRVTRTGSAVIPIVILLTVGKDEERAVTPDPQVVLKPS